LQVKVTNLDSGSYENRPHPKRKLAHEKSAVNIDVQVSVVESEITDQMRASYNRFWQLLIGRMLDKGPDP